jgi:hypothetical protein
MVCSAASHLRQATDGNGELMFLVTRSLVVPLRILSAVISPSTCTDVFNVILSFHEPDAMHYLFWTL